VRDLQRVTVFCGSSSGADPAFVDAARDLGAALADVGAGLVYGGASVGLMGELADAVIAAGGEATGIYPDVFTRDVSHGGLTELRLVADMHERKRLMYELGDGIIALPGGLGTLEEVFEAATWNQIGLHEAPHPIALLNASGYYDGLMRFLEHAVDQGLLKPKHLASISLTATPAEAIAHLRSFRFADVEQWS
jgi:uncharacterized protein (TIGR00730 family)